MILIGGFPGDDGDTYADFFPMSDGTMPFPGWGPFEGPDSADLANDTKQRMADEAIPVPEAAAKGVVRLTTEQRFSVPVTLVCPEFTPEQAKATIADGEIPELSAAGDVSFVDIDTGHWPMFTRPRELATLLDQVAREDAR